MAQPFHTIDVEITGEIEARGVVLALFTRSAWFEVTPMPDDKWVITTKPENQHIMPQSALITNAGPLPGCN